MSSLKPASLNTIGQTYHDFKVTKVVPIPELQCCLRELVHVPTGAEVMHISNEDPENLFCLSFPTIPYNSNGVAHILEHTVLCGSEKYPIKDPFFVMTRRSLNTFMNALTGSDFTCYPAASQVSKDFYNLFEVYLDAVFKPLLNELSFLQEGHRLEFEVPDDPSTPLTHKGVVFNEMKGALSSGSSRLMEAMNAALYPNVTYGYNSGGDPKDIPNLTYEELRQFHQTFYHPSRCLFFFYGNMPLEKHLDFINEHTLKHAKKQGEVAPVPNQPRFFIPRYLTLDYPISQDEEYTDKTMIAFGWLTTDILNQEEVLALSILEIILMDTDASPLKLALLKSGLCKQATIFMDAEISEVPIVINLRGCEQENAGQLDKIVQETLQQIVDEGISLESFESAMHQLEFARSEIVGNHSPFGLSLFMRSALLQHHRVEPEDGLMIHSLFDQLRRKFLKDPKYFTGLISKYLIGNSHKVRITMVPSRELASKESAEETETLNQIRQRLTQKEIAQIIQKSAELAEFQKKQEEEDIEVLPKITMDDVPKFTREYDLHHEKIGSLSVYRHACFTNEIVYADLIYDLPDIAENDLALVRLFVVVFTQMGCGGRSYAENLEYIQANTGGVGASLAFNIQVGDYNQFIPSLYIRGKALYRKANKLFTLLHEIVSSVDFTDTERLKEVLLKHYTVLQSTLTQSAMRYAMSLSASSLDIPSRISNTWNGLDYYWMVKDLAENIDTTIHTLAQKLQRLQDQLLGLENPNLVITCSKEMYDELKGHRFYGLADLKTKPSPKWIGDYKLPHVLSQGRIIASPIAFTSHTFKTVPYVHPDTPALTVAASLFENIVLHKKIREQGGAYGGGASINTMSGIFSFYGYRDPNIISTLEAFEESVKTIVEGDFEESDLEEAKLEVIQSLDAPVAPGSRGELAYSRLREGKTKEVRQAFRDRLLSLTREDVIAAVKRQVLMQNKGGKTVVFAGKELLEKENARLQADHKPTFPIETI